MNKHININLTKEIHVIYMNNCTIKDEHVKVEQSFNIVRKIQWYINNNYYFLSYTNPLPERAKSLKIKY